VGDRTHRIGQTRAVMVYRLIARELVQHDGRPAARIAPSPGSACRTPPRSRTCGTQGDAVKQIATGGTAACAETGQIVADAVLTRRWAATHPPPPG
jgi:hypothetical protein